MAVQISLQRSGGGTAGPRWWLGGGAFCLFLRIVSFAGPAGPAGLVCPCCRVRSATASAVSGVPLLHATLHVPGETLGSVRATASSSLLSFLKVLLGTWCLRVLGAWRKSSEGAAVVCHPRLVDQLLLALVSLFVFFLGHFCVVSPSVVLQLYGWLLY